MALRGSFYVSQMKATTASWSGLFSPPLSVTEADLLEFRYLESFD